MKKTIFSALTAFCLLMTPAMAVENTTADAEQASISSQQMAYMSIDDVDVATQIRIIEARNEIIFSESWVADGVSARVRDENGNVIEELPQFSEVFPEDWEVPNIPTDVNKSGESLLTDITRAWDSWSYSLLLKSPPADTFSSPFKTIASSGFPGTSSAYYIKTLTTNGYPVRSDSSATYNIGYSNYSTGASLVWKERLAQGKSLDVNPPRNITVAIRASTYSSPQNWNISVGADRYNG